VAVKVQRRPFVIAYSVILVSVMVGWMVFNGQTSVDGLRYLFGAQKWVWLLGLIFPLTDVIAIGSHVASQYFVDEGGRPLIESQTMNFVWSLWATVAFVDVFLTIIFLDKFLQENIQAGGFIQSFFVPEFAVRWIPFVAAVLTYVVTVLVVYVFRDTLAGALGEVFGAGSSTSRPSGGAKSKRGREGGRTTKSQGLTRPHPRESSYQPKHRPQRSTGQPFDPLEGTGIDVGEILRGKG